MGEQIGDAEKELWFAVIANAVKRRYKIDRVEAIQFLKSNWCKTICSWIEINYDSLLTLYEKANNKCLAGK